MAGDAYISHKNKLIALWSPKSACTAVVEWFAAMEGCDAKHKRNWLKANGHYQDYEQAYAFQVNQGYRVIQFTRSPYSRSVSSFLNKFLIYDLRPLTSEDCLEDFSRDLIHQSKRLERNEFEYQGLSFIEYLKTVRMMMSEKKQINHHWDSQLPRSLNFRVKPDFVVHQESFKEDLTQLNSILGFSNFVPGVRNRTRWPADFNESIVDESETSTLDLIKHKKKITKENLLSKEAISLINEMYHEDFLFFDYPMVKTGNLFSRLRQAVKRKFY